MIRTCEKCIHHDVCRYPLEYRAFPDTCWKYEEERQHGEWIEANSTDLKCSICGYRKLKERTLVTSLNYCSLCGASMQKEGEAE